MRNKINPNDPAIPNHHMASGEMSCDPNKRGLSIRTELAARAMQGLLSNPVYNNPNDKNKMVTVPNLAKAALSYADALINELNKGA